MYGTRKAYKGGSKYLWHGDSQLVSWVVGATLGNYMCQSSCGKVWKLLLVLHYAFSAIFFEIPELKDKIRFDWLAHVHINHTMYI